MLPSPLLAILDLKTLGADLPRLASKARSGGVAWMLLRAPEATTTERIELARKVLRAAPGVALSIHGDEEAARAAGGLGVHFPSARIEECARSGASPKGASCHGEDELRRAALAGADYCFLSPVFAPLSKPPTAPPLGIAGFGALAGAAKLPVYALGGVTPDAVAELARAGAAGVAAIGGLFGTPDVARSAAEWVEAVREAFGRM